MKPQEIWDMELWEYNAYITSYGDKRKYDTAFCILSGYYAAYYTNGGKIPMTLSEICMKRNRVWMKACAQ